MKFEYEIRENDSGKVTFGDLNYNNDFFVLNSKDEKVDIKNNVTIFKNNVELTINSPEWTDFSKATCTIQHQENSGSIYRATFDNVELKEKHRYNVFFTNGDEKVDIQIDENGAVKNEYSFITDGKTVNGDIGDIIEKSGKIYVYVVEEQSDNAKGAFDSTTKLVLDKKEVERPAQHGFTNRVNIAAVSQNFGNFLSIQEPISKDRKIYITLGKVTDNSILSAIHNKETNGMSRLLEYAKKQSGIETYTIIADGKGIIDLGELETKILNKTSDASAYYYMYFRADNENGKYIDVEDVNLYHRGDSFGIAKLLGSNQADFEWGDIGETPEAPKQDETPKDDTNKDTPKDDTVAKDDRLPSTGIGIGLTLSIALVSIAAIITFKKIKYYKGL